MSDWSRPSVASVDASDLATVLDAVADFLSVFTADGEFVYWNDGLSRVTGYGDDQLREMSPETLFAADDRSRIADAIATVAADGDQVAVDAELATADGRSIPYEFAVAPLGVTEGGEDALAGVGRDVSDRVEHERELRRQNERLEEFTTVVSHDLRNPLDVANARLELAASDCESEHIAVARESIRRMASIVEDTLTLARQGEGDVEADRIRLSRAAEDAWRQVETGQAALEIPEDCNIRADPDRVKHVFENLFRNAVEHGVPDEADGDGRERPIQVRVGPTEDGFYVADDGVGIEPEERDRVFDPGVTNANDGTGFGLSIVRRVADAHGWEVRATESVDGGARFEFAGVEPRSEKGQ